MPTGSDRWRGERSDPSLELAIELATTGEIVLPPELALEPVARIGRYDLLGRMAVGGMAEIYFAREDATAGATRYLVVKVVRPHLANDSEFGEMFLNEGRVALRLKHPHICHVYEFGVDAGRYFMAMEYVHGVTLRKVLRRTATLGRPLPLPVAVRIIAHVAEALASAHKTRDEEGRGVIHRDVTPQNVMIGFDGVVKLLDFGIAQPQGDRTEADSGMFKGKVAYLAPEQCTGSPVDGRSDIFSLGHCMWELLTGRPLFKRKNEVETLLAIVRDPVPDPAELGVDLPKALVDVLKDALEKNPAHRYQSAGEMDRALQQYLVDNRHLVNTTVIAKAMAELFADEINRGPTLDRSEEVVSKLQPASKKQSPAAEDPARAPEPPPTRRRGLASVLVLTVFVLAGGVAYALLRAPTASSGEEAGGFTVPADVGQPPRQAVANPSEPMEDEPQDVAEAEPAAGASADAGTDAAEGEAEDGEERDRRPRGRLRTKKGFIVEPDF